MPTIKCKGRLLGFLIVAMMSCVGHSALANAVVIDSVRIRLAPDRTRIVFDLSGPVEHRIFALVSPNRLVIDIDGATLDQEFSAAELKGTPIRSVRAGIRDSSDLRVVLDLRDEVKPRSFVLKPILQYGDRLEIGRAHV